MASTESGQGVLQPVAERPLIGVQVSTYASSTWTFALPLPNGGALGATIAEVRSSAGAVKDVTITKTGNVLTIADGEDTLAASDVATVFYSINY